MSPTYKSFGAFDYHGSNARRKLLVFSTHCLSKCRDIPISTLVEELKPLVMDKYESECRDFSLLRTYWHSRKIKVWMQGLNTVIFKFSSLPNRISLKLRPYIRKIESAVMESNELDYRKNVWKMAIPWLLRTIRKSPKKNEINCFKLKILCN